MDNEAKHGLLTLLTIWSVFMLFALRVPQQAYTWARKTYARRHAPRLCGYHTGVTLRVGQMAILDSANCEECAREQQTGT